MPVSRVVTPTACVLFTCCDGCPSLVADCVQYDKKPRTKFQKLSNLTIFFNELKANYEELQAGATA